MSRRDFLSLTTTFGFNKLSQNSVNYVLGGNILFSSSNSIVLCDPVTGKQKILQGHVNPITVLATSKDYKYFISADSGIDSLIILWETHKESLNATPVEIYHSPHGNYGVLAGVFSKTGFYTLGNDPVQTICKWNYKSNLAAVTIPLVSLLRQSQIYLSPSENELITLGPKGIYFIDIVGLSIQEPKVTAKDFKIMPSDYTCLTFTDKVVFGNQNGELIFFNDKTTLKYLKIDDSPITCIQSGKCMITTTKKGIKYFDFEGKLLYGFELDGVEGISVDPLHVLFDDSDLPAVLVYTRDVIYKLERNAKSCLIPLPQKGSTMELALDNGDLRTGKPNLTVLVQGLPPNIVAVDMSPTDSNLFVIGTGNGVVQVWNHSSRCVVSSRHFTSPPVTKNGGDLDKPITSVAFSSSGKCIAVGFKTSLLFTTLDLVDLPDQYFTLQNTPTSITFSKDGSYCAITSSSSLTLLHKPISTWINLLSTQPHFMQIVSVHFTSDCIFLVSLDRHVTSISLPNLEMVTRRVESVYRPTTSILLNNDIMIFNTSSKAKLFSSAMECKKTLRAPIVERVVAMSDFGVFKAGKVMGVLKLDDIKYLSVIGHGCGIVDVKVCDDVVVSLGSDGSVNIWKSDCDVVNLVQQNDIELLERHEAIENGMVFKTFEDYFYLLQLDDEGETTGTIHISKLPKLMQAMGYYPPKQEINDMKNEVLYARLAEGNRSERVDIMYLNHKPEGGIKLHEIENSLSHVKTDGKISQDKLKSLVMQFGEAVGDLEFHHLGLSKTEKMSTAEFVKDLLKMQI